MTTPTPSDDSPLARPWLAVALIALAGLFAYFNSFHGAFVFDDVVYINPDELAHPLRNKLATGRPVVAISLYLNHAFDGVNPRGYHLVNLAVHILAALVLFDLVRRTLLLPRFAGRLDRIAAPVGLAVAVLWTVHPLQTQSVTYVIQRCESMMGLFFLLALWAFVRGATADRGAVWWYLAAAGSAVLGAGCKEVIVALPAVALLYDRTFLTNSWWKLLRTRWWVHGLLAVAAGLLLGWVFLRGWIASQDAVVGLGVTGFTPATYALTETHVVLYYLRLAAWPDALCLDYIDWPPLMTLADAWPYVIGVALLAALTLYGLYRRAWWGFLGACYFLILAPTSSVMPIQDVAFEHRMYLPLVFPVGLAVGAAAWALTALARRPGWERTASRIAWVGGGALAVVLGLTTVVRNEAYGSQLKMFADVVAKRPGNFRGHNNLANAQLAAHKPEEALKEAEIAARIQPANPINAHTYALALLETGRPGPALDVFVQIAHLDPANPAFANIPGGIGQTYLILGRPADAVPHLERARGVAPKFAFVRTLLALAYLGAGRPVEADAEFAAARDLDPGYARRLAQVSRVLAMTREPNVTQKAQAVLYARAASRMAGDVDPESLDGLAIALATAGRFDEAVKYEELAVSRAAESRQHYAAQRMALRQGLFRAKKRYLPENWN